MLGLDVVALIAYDQTQSSRETEAGLAYWTIIGATSSPPSNATHTLMEAVVYDIKVAACSSGPGTGSRGHATCFAP